MEHDVALLIAENVIFCFYCAFIVFMQQNSFPLVGQSDLNLTELWWEPMQRFTHDSGRIIQRHLKKTVPCPCTWLQNMKFYFLGKSQKRLERWTQTKDEIWTGFRLKSQKWAPESECGVLKCHHFNGRRYVMTSPKGLDRLDSCIKRLEKAVKYFSLKPFNSTGSYLLIALVSPSSPDSQPVINMIMSRVSNEASAVTSAATLGSPWRTAGSRKHSRISLRLNWRGAPQTPRTHSILSVCVNEVSAAAAAHR